MEKPNLYLRNNLCCPDRKEKRHISHPEKVPEESPIVGYDDYVRLLNFHLVARVPTGFRTIYATLPRFQDKSMNLLHLNQDKYCGKYVNCCYEPKTQAPLLQNG